MTVTIASEVMVTQTTFSTLWLRKTGDATMKEEANRDAIKTRKSIIFQYDQRKENSAMVRRVGGRDVQKGVKELVLRKKESEARTKERNWRCGPADDVKERMCASVGMGLPSLLNVGACIFCLVT